MSNVGDSGLTGQAVGVEVNVVTGSGGSSNGGDGGNLIAAMEARPTAAPAD